MYACSAAGYSVFIKMSFCSWIFKLDRPHCNVPLAAIDACFNCKFEKKKKTKNINKVNRPNKTPIAKHEPLADATLSNTL